jgi:hypothetical protein
MTASGPPASESAISQSWSSAGRRRRVGRAQKRARKADGEEPRAGLGADRLGDALEAIERRQRHEGDATAREAVVSGVARLAPARRARDARRR